MLGLPSPALYVGAGLIALLVASGALNACQHRESAALRDSLAAERAARAVAVEANQTQSEAITRLEAAVGQWQAAATVADDIRAQAAQAEDYRAQLDSARRQFAEVKTRESQTHPSCLTLLAADLGAACPDTAGRLRELADGDRENANSGGAGARTPAPP